MTKKKSLQEPIVTISNTSTFTIDGLEPGSWYTIVVFSVDAKGRQSLKESPLLTVLTCKYWQLN